MNILVIDVGTSSMRGILFDELGQNLIEAQELYRASYLENSWVEQNPADWEQALYSILRQVSAEAETKNQKIDAISITSQRSSVIPVDREMNPLCNAIMWQDKRTNYLCERMEGLNDQVFSRCGSRINPVFSATKMTWIREERPELYDRTYKFMVIPDYMIYLMTGRICTDYTYGSRSLLMNIRTHEWDEELLELFHVEQEKLCELTEPGSICGYTTNRISTITGCPKGIPVITAGGDQQCGAIGQGVVKKGILSVTTGTGGYLITETDQVPENLEQDVICNVSSVKGQYILESSVLTCCSAFDWFRKEFFPETSFDEINRQIKETPAGSNGCLCIPYFMGRSTPDWNNMAKGVFANMTLGTTKQDMLRSLLEGICFEIRNGIDVMNKYLKVSDIYINGGLSNSEPFNEMQANVYGMKLVRRGKADATARGALMVAAASMSIYASVEEAFDKISKQDKAKVYLPDETIVLQYERYRAQMNQNYRKLWGGKEEEAI
ncbi:MAG: FGGY family carbohydrate kinase [Lachnospiraceae bacterium]|nr:FGGY family carbohydrate kinase [Lachnospiraceae bacterium]